MNASSSLNAYQGHAALKAEVLQRLIHHIEADQLSPQGRCGWDPGEQIGTLTGLTAHADSEVQYEQILGWPAALGLTHQALLDACIAPRVNAEGELAPSLPDWARTHATAWLLATKPGADLGATLVGFQRRLAQALIDGLPVIGALSSDTHQLVSRWSALVDRADATGSDWAELRSAARLAQTGVSEGEATALGLVEAVAWPASAAANEWFEGLADFLRQASDIGVEKLLGSPLAQQYLDSRTAWKQLESRADADPAFDPFAEASKVPALAALDLPETQATLAEAFVRNVRPLVEDLLALFLDEVIESNSMGSEGPLRTIPSAAPTSVAEVEVEVIEATVSGFDEEVLRSATPVLVDFWAAWCNPCKQFMPTLRAVAQEYAGRVKCVKVNVDEQPELRERYGVRGLPTLLLFSAGEVADRLQALNRSRLTALLDKQLSKIQEAGRNAGVPMDTPNAAEVPLIPRTLLFGNPERGSCTISPCGRWLAFAAPLEGVMNLWVCERDADVATARAVTRDRHRGVERGVWAHDGLHLLYQQDNDGDENFHLYAVTAAGGAARNLTPFPQARGLLQARSPRHPHEVLVTMNDRDPSFADLYRVDLRTGDRTLVQRNEDFADFAADDDFRVHAGTRANEDGTFSVLRLGADGQWRQWQEIPAVDAMGTEALHVDAAGSCLYMLDSRGRDTAVLVSFDLSADAPQAHLIAGDARADIDEVFSHPVTRIPQAYSVSFERREKHLLDPTLEADFTLLDSQALGDWRITGRSLDDRWWCVQSGSDIQAPSAYLYDRERRSLRKLYDMLPKLAAAPLVAMRHRTLASRDGLPLVSYLTLPANSGVDGDAWGSRRPMPTVLLVHGGPWARDEWGFNDEHQWLANRGYAVLSVNFRGSTGFGKGFVAAGDREWGARMNADLIDAIEFLVAQGIADPARICIMGSSYGGYAALWGLVDNPLRYACGVDIVGPSNLETLLDSIPPHWESGRAALYRQVGNPTTPDGQALLRERSPLHRAAQIRRPLLIAQGANDPRVKQAEADQMVAALQANSIPVTYTLYPDEGHGFVRPANRLAFYAVVETFLARHLGGRVEPCTEQEIEGHTTVVVTGAESVPSAILSHQSLEGFDVSL